MAALNTYYDTLQISRLASDSVIKAAYRTLSQQYHPDKNPDSRDKAEREMKRLNEAYSVLSDADRRAAYDTEVERKEREVADDIGNAQRAAAQAQAQAQARAQAARAAAEAADREAARAAQDQEIQQAGQMYRQHPGVATPVKTDWGGIFWGVAIIAIALVWVWPKNGAKPDAPRASVPALAPVVRPSVIAKAPPQGLYEATVSAIEARHPELDVQSPSYNQSLDLQFTAAARRYIDQGVLPSDALLRVEIDYVREHDPSRPQPQPAQPQPNVASNAPARARPQPSSSTVAVTRRTTAPQLTAANQQSEEGGRPYSAQEKADLNVIAARAMQDYPYLATPGGQFVRVLIVKRRDELVQQGVYPSIALTRAVAAFAPGNDPSASQKPAEVKRENTPNDRSGFPPGCRWVTPSEWSCK